MLHTVPQPVKWSLDGVAIGAGVAHFLGWWHDNVGTLTATVGLAWIIVQAFFYLKDRYKK